MNLAELSKLDIKDLQKLDYVKLLQDLKKRPDVLVSVVLVVLTVFFSLNAFWKKQNALSSIQQEVSILEGKIKVLEGYETVKKQLSNFLKNIPEKLSENDLINKVTDLAVKQNVQIESYSPAKKQSSALYELTSIFLNVSAPDYKNVWFFMNDIEKSKYSIRVESWSGNLGGGDSRNNSRKKSIPGGAPESAWVSVQLEIASINLKNE